MELSELYKNVLQIPPVKLTPATKGGSQRLFGSPFLAICDAFEIDTQDQAFRNAFDASTSGPGKEINRITTLHSSALLSLLVFYGVSDCNTITLRGTKYTKCFFEATNKVFSHPSSVDVVLVSDDGKTMLFLESKFTEYTHHGKIWMSDVYENFYDRVLEQLENAPIHIERGIIKKFKEKTTGKVVDKKGIELHNGSANKPLRNSEYLGGIKQCFSHLIGIAKGPDEKACEEYRDCFSKASNLCFGTILFDCTERKEIDSYIDLYKKTIGKLNSIDLAKALPDFKENCHKVAILHEPLIYQEILKKTDYIVPPKIKQFYKL